jgi:hypothetical protein
MSGWTTPKTWTSGEVVSKADLDTYVRDNPNFLKLNIALEMPSILTIDTGEVTKAQSHHAIAAESGTEDDLDTINDGADGDVLLLRADTGDTITLKHDVDNLYNPLEEDVEITDSSYAILVSNGTNWIIFASGLSATGIQDLIDAAITAHSGDEDPHGDRAYADGLIAAADAMVFKGAIDCSGNPNYPAADCGHTYKISVAGKIGGASGITVEAGDTAICLVDSSASGDQAAVGANWVVLQTNIDSSILPTADQKAALAGTSGTPSGTNKYVTDEDSRLGTGGGSVGWDAGEVADEVPTNNFRVNHDLGGV